MSVLYVFLTLFVILCCLPLLYLLGRGVRSINRIEFYTKGLDAGFSWREIGLLWKTAAITRHQRPSSLFWSLDVLDKSIAGIHKKKEGEEDADEKEYLEYLLRKIYQYRKKIEFKKPRYNRGVESTWEIPLNQVLKLKVDMVGVYECSVIENNRNYMVVSYPKGPTPPLGFSWRDRDLKVYFWKREDAGYFFQARIMEGYPDRSFQTLRMTHSDGVLRSQKRRSVRTPCEIPAQLYPVRSVQTASLAPESKPGLRCILQDLSEDGASLIIGGRGERNMSLKLQFELYGKIVMMRGIVRTVRYEEEKNLSHLHIQAVEPDEGSRYQILAFVYDIFRSERQQPSQTVPAARDVSDDGAEKAPEEEGLMGVAKWNVEAVPVQELDGETRKPAPAEKAGEGREEEVPSLESMASLESFEEDLSFLREQGDEEE